MLTNSTPSPSLKAKPGAPDPEAHWLDRHIAEQAAYYGITVEQKKVLFDGAAQFDEMILEGIVEEPVRI